MSRTTVVLCVGLSIGWVASLFAQQPAAVVNSQTAVIPALVNYNGMFTDASGRTVTSLTGVTFLICKDEQGGAPLWLETQNVTPDKLGHYTVQLGATTAHGLPSDLFQSGEARWLAVQLAGEGEQPRVALVAVPYAMKAADAATIGGLPPSAFVRSTPQAATSGNPSSTMTSSVSNTRPSAGTLNVSAKPASSTPAETQNYVARFVNTTGGLGNYNAGPDSTTPALTNSTAIGAYADVTASNALVLGSTATQNGSANVSVGIDVGNPSNILTVLQGGGHAIADGWDTYSSRRWKTNIHTLHRALGKVERLRGVSYELKDSGKHEIGVIAEEVGAVVPEVVSYETNSKDARGVDYSRLTALLIEATKEQQALIQHQQEQIRLQQAQIAALSRQVRSVQAALKVSGQTKVVHNVKAEVLPPPH